MQRVSKKTYVHFSNNTSPIGRVIINLGICGKYDLFVKIHNINYRLEIRRRHQKSYVTLIINLVYFERPYYPCKVS